MFRRRDAGTVDRFAAKNAGRRVRGKRALRERDDDKKCNEERDADHSPFIDRALLPGQGAR